MPYFCLEFLHRVNRWVGRKHGKNSPCEIVCVLFGNDDTYFLVVYLTDCSTIIGNVSV